MESSERRMNPVVMTLSCKTNCKFHILKIMRTKNHGTDVENTVEPTSKTTLFKKSFRKTKQRKRNIKHFYHPISRRKVRPQFSYILRFRRRLAENTGAEQSRVTDGSVATSARMLNFTPTALCN